jgi:hypothetical protein
VEVGGAITLVADAADPDRDQVTVQWSAAAGTLGDRAARQTGWTATAPLQEGPVPVTVTVTDGKGGVATDAVTIQVTKTIKQ